MPALDWIGKSAVVDWHRRVPYHLLHCNGALSAGAADCGNLLVQGDNLEALKALLPYYAGQVKCVYIDPPYNTGNERWSYSDKVNHPQIRKWLKKVVGGEADDLSRHDKWLCMMHPRLMLIKNLMADSAVIFISIGKDEFGHLKVLCDEIFGASNFLETFIWQIEGNVENQEDIKSTHEYVLAYQKQKGTAGANIVLDPNVSDDSKLLRDFTENSIIKNGPGNPASVIELPVGFPCAADLDIPRHKFADKFIAEVKAGDGWIKREMRQRYDVNYPIRLDDMIAEDGALVRSCRVYSGWASARKLKLFIQNDLSPLAEEDGATLRYFIAHTGVPTYRKENRKAHFVETVLRNMGTTERSSNRLERAGINFPYPKPVTLVEYLIELYTKPGDLVLDSFCGSGTTGHAVLKINSEKRKRLKFILVEMDHKIATEAASKWLKTVIGGYKERRGKAHHEIKGLGGGFRFCKLGGELFAADGRIATDIKFADLAAHVFFVATGSPIPKRASGKTPLLGVYNKRAIYLLFNGVLGDKAPNGGNVLTRAILADLPPHDGEKIIYGEGCLLSDARQKRERIIFRQLPYAIRDDA